jgi:hypothetical protein
MVNSQETEFFRLVIGVGMLLAVAIPAKATFIVGGNMADQTTFLNLINADTQGGAWSINNMSQLVFTDNVNVIDNNYATQLNALNNVNNVRSVGVMQNAPGVLVGAFGPTLNPALPQGTQVIDLGDIQAFTANGGAQVQPILSTRGSVLLHELAELNNDGGAANLNNAHNAGILMENNILLSQGVSGMRVAGGTLTVTPPPRRGRTSLDSRQQSRSRRLRLSRPRAASRPGPTVLGITSASMAGSLPRGPSTGTSPILHLG